MAEFLWTWGFVLACLTYCSFFTETTTDGLNWCVLLGVDETIFFFDRLLFSQLSLTSLKSSFLWPAFCDTTYFLTGFMAIFSLSASSSSSDSYSIDSSDSHSLPYTKSSSILTISGSWLPSSESESLTGLKSIFYAIIYVTKQKLTAFRTIMDWFVLL